MADISNEYGVDPNTGERFAIDPPLQESETPLMGNPVLMRSKPPRRAKSNTALYAGAAVAVIALLAGGAYLFASGAQQRNDLMTKSEMTPPAQQQAAATPAPAPLTSSPVVTPAPSLVVAPAETPVQPIHAPRAQRAGPWHMAACGLGDPIGNSTIDVWVRHSCRIEPVFAWGQVPRLAPATS